VQVRHDQHPLVWPVQRARRIGEKMGGQNPEDRRLSGKRRWMRQNRFFLADARVRLQSPARASSISASAASARMLS
jgi:hypothetical protein